MALAKVKDDLSRYLRLAAGEEIVITRHGRPAGVLIGFASEEDWFEYRLEILDEAGTVVRRYRSDDPPEPPVESRNIPDYWIRPRQPLPATSGLHRFVWDLRYPPPAVLQRSYPIAAIYRNTPAEPRGPWTVPGAYTVRLTAGGRILSRPLRLKMDPRVKRPPDGLREQLGRSHRRSSRTSRAASRRWRR